MQNIKNGRLTYRRIKTEGITTITIDIPIHPKLQEVLNSLPKNRLTFLETNGGKSRSSNGLGNMMRKWCDEAGLKNCTAHGLRKTCATRLAEAGASEREIMSWTGHSDPKMVQTYASKAKRPMMADRGYEKLIQNEQGSNLDEPEEKGSTK